MLSGTLDDFTLTDVLRLIAGARRTGGLAVERDGGTGSLFFRDGALSGAVPGYDRRTGPSSPAGAIEDLAFDLMRWERGQFGWTPGAAAPGGPEASLGVDELLTAVSLRLEELAEIHTLVPSEETVPAMAPQPPEGAVQINITPAEWRVLVLVDGHRTVSEIAGAAHLDDLEAMKLLYGLAAAGLVTTGSPAPVVPLQEPADMADTADTAVVSVMSDTPREETYEPPAPAPAAVEDPFLAELDSQPTEAAGAPEVDRSTAARELAGLFEDFEAPVGMQGITFGGPPAPPRVPRRVEDDDQVTRGLISRLIDGVKGL